MFTVVFPPLFSCSRFQGGEERHRVTPPPYLLSTMDTLPSHWPFTLRAWRLTVAAHRQETPHQSHRIRCWQTELSPELWYLILPRGLPSPLRSSKTVVCNIFKNTNHPHISSLPGIFSFSIYTLLCNPKPVSPQKALVHPTWGRSGNCWFCPEFPQAADPPGKVWYAGLQGATASQESRCSLLRHFEFVLLN